MKGFSGSSAGKESACNAGDPGSIPGSGRSIPWRREQLPTPVFWPGEFRGLYSPWGCRVRHNWATFTLTWNPASNKVHSEIFQLLIVPMKVCQIQSILFVIPFSLYEITKNEHYGAITKTNPFNSVHIWLVLVKRNHRSRRMRPAGSASKHYYLTVQSSVTTVVFYFRCCHPAHSALGRNCHCVWCLQKKIKQ